jgi:3D (Asp-Asp-Asp) domain-containing protein
MRSLIALPLLTLLACGGSLDHVSVARDMAASADMTSAEDMADAPDLATPPDMSPDAAPDLAVADMATPPADMAAQDMAPDMADPPDMEPLPPGDLLASDVRLTYYWLAREGDYAGAGAATLYDAACKPLATVSDRFSDAICIEGSGKLEDGRVLNYEETCSCGRPCPTGGTICYSALDPTAFPWGKGNRNNALIPMRSVATDRALIPSGTVLYIPEWDGVTVPTAGGVLGFVHDGCMRADDVGGAIGGAHIDVFSGEKSVRTALEQVRPTNTELTIYRAHAQRCAQLR